MTRSARPCAERALAATPTPLRAGAFHRARVQLRVAVAAALVLAACGSDALPDPGIVADPRQPVQEMLQARARRLSAGDAEGYLAPMAPEARAVEEPIARGALAVQVSEVNLAMDEADFAPEGDRVTGARVDFVYRYPQLPRDNEFRLRLNYEIERRDGAWIVTKSEPDPDVYGPLPIWATGPVQVARSPHFVVLSRPGLAGVDRSLDIAEEARSQLLERLTLVPDQVHLLVLAKGHQEFADLLGDEGLPEDVLAAAGYHFSETRGHESRPEGRALVVKLDGLVGDPSRKVELDPNHGARLDGKAGTEGGMGGMGGMGAGGRQMGGGHGTPPGTGPQRPPSDLTARQVFQHELGHLALSRFTRRSTPPWVVEGGAMQLSGERRVGEWKFLLDHRPLLDEPALSFAKALTRNPLKSALQYGYVNAAVSYLVETSGPAKFWDFYRNFKEYDRGSEAHPLEEVWPDATHRLLRRMYDLEEAQLDTKTLEYLERGATGPR